MGCAGSKEAADQTEQARHTGKEPSKPGVGGYPSAQPLYSSPVSTKTSEAPRNAANPHSQTLTGPPSEPARKPEPAGAGSEASDEGSDWDQCETRADELETKEEKATDAPVCEESPNHPLMHANSMFLEQGRTVLKETGTLRIEKIRGCMFVNQYLMVKFLGRGACGKVFLCLNTHDLRLYAMKAVRKTDLDAAAGSVSHAGGQKKQRNPMEDLKREIMIMRTMHHNNIVMLSEVIDDPSGSKLLLVMEYMEGGPVLTRESLEKRERVPETLGRHYFRDMIKALDYLHCQKVVHGDLKPDNVLMSASGDVKLSDFGCSKIFVTGNEYLERCNGTPAFLAPEMMKPNTRYRGRPTDVYALGACLYTLVYGRIPFSAPNLYKLFQVVQNEPVRYPSDVQVSNELRDLIERMMTKNPRERISVNEIMKHPWLSCKGQYPLKSCKDLRDGETQDAHNGVAPGPGFLAANPRPQLITALASSASHERTFNEGDVLMKQGENGVFMVYIVSGMLDILVRSASSHRASLTGAAPHHRGRGGDEMDGMDDGGDGGSAPGQLDEEGQRHRATLGHAATKARELIAQLQHSAGGVNARELLLAQRGPGEVVGEMALFHKEGIRCATVRCAARTTVRIITQDTLVDFVRNQPLLKHQMREVMWRRESESTMVDALFKLASVQEEA